MAEKQDAAPRNPNSPTVKPQCSRCGTHRFTFAEVYGPAEEVGEIKAHIEAVRAQAESRAKECEAWFDKQMAALEQAREKQIEAAQPDMEESAFKLLSDDAQVREKIERIEEEYEKAKQARIRQKAELDRKVRAEKEEALRRRVGPENVVLVVYCEQCGLIQGIAELAKQQEMLAPKLEEGMQTLETAIRDMHSELAQALSLMVEKLTAFRETTLHQSTRATKSEQ